MIIAKDTAGTAAQLRARGFDVAEKDPAIWLEPCAGGHILHGCGAAGVVKPSTAYNLARLILRHASGERTAERLAPAYADEIVRPRLLAGERTTRSAVRAWIAARG